MRFLKVTVISLLLAFLTCSLPAQVGIPVTLSGDQIVERVSNCAVLILTGRGDGLLSAIGSRPTEASGGVITRHAHESPPSAAGGTFIDYGQSARCTLAEKLQVPTEQIRVVDVTFMKPDHRHWHRRHGVSPDNMLVLGDNAFVLVALDAGFGNRSCGLFRILYRVGIEKGFGDEAVIDTKSQYMIENECQSVASELERFSSVAFDLQRGPERFIPFLSEQLTTDLGHTSEEKALTAQENRFLVTQYLDFLFVVGFAALEISELSAELVFAPLEDESRWEHESFANAGKLFGQYTEQLRKNLAEFGLLGFEHLNALKLFLQKAMGFSLLDKHVADSSNAYLPPGTVFYHVTEGPIDFLFIWEGARLRLISILCTA